MEAAKKIASMWTNMAQLLRSELLHSVLTKIHTDIIIHLFKNFFRKECVFKEKQLKEDIVDLAKSINKESQGVMKVATSVAEACTDTIMRKVLHSILICIQ